MNYIEGKQQQVVGILLFLLAIVSLYICFTETGAGLSGDSVKHFLLAKYAPEQTELFFNHWGKPFFTFLAVFPARFGFVGIKLFNIVLAVLSAYFTFKVAILLKEKNAFMSVLLTLGGTFFFLRMFTGLTEYLSAAMLIVGVYLQLKNKSNWAALILSFTPFVRSEGLILIGVFACYYVLKKNYRPLIYLAIGHVVFSFVGYFWYQDFLWIFTKIPYAHISSVYGQGNYTHFLRQMMYILGVPIYTFLIIGLVRYWIDFAQSRNKYSYFKSEYSLLVVALAVGFFVAHTLFWALGIFNSMGLNRVFITVVPLFALIALRGFNSLVFIFRKGLVQQVTLGILMFLTIGFQFTKNHASIRYNYDELELTPSYAQFEIEVKRGIDFTKYDFFYSSDPYFSYSLGYNLMDSKVSAGLPTDGKIKKEQRNAVVVWDRWYGPVETNCSLKTLEKNKKLNKIYEVKNEEGIITIAIFEPLK